MSLTVTIVTQADLDVLNTKLASDDATLAAHTSALSALQSAVAALQPPPAPPVVVPPLVVSPGAVTNLAVTNVTATSATLGFTEVADGAGGAASYAIRYAAGTLAWGSATALPPLAGTVVGAARAYTISGLLAGTTYQFQLVAFRGTLNVNAVFGALSNVATATTATVAIAPPPPPLATGVVFQSDWTALDPSDGGRWQHYWEFNNNTGVILMSVVPNFGPGGRNALKVLQRGSVLAANVQQDNVVPLSTDFYVRFYMRNDDTSGAGDHVVTVDTWGYANLTFVRKFNTSTGWKLTISLYGCGYTYPIGHWSPALELAHGAWYRFEYWVHYVDATHVQVHPRVYDAAGTLILSDADLRQSDYGTQLWNGRSDWTFASYYAAGYTFCVVPALMANFGMGNNGQQGAIDTGLAWYFAGVQLRTDTWAGA